MASARKSIRGDKYKHGAVLSFTEPLVFTHNAGVEMVTYGSQFFRVDYIRV